MSDLSDLAYMPAAYLAARVFLASVFVYSGFDKLLNWRGVIAECEAFKLPFPKLCAAGTVALHIMGGLAIVFGVYVTPFALILAFFTAIATCLAHNFWAYQGERFGKELTTALEHLGLIGGLILLAAISYHF